MMLLDRYYSYFSERRTNISIKKIISIQICVSILLVDKLSLYLFACLMMKRKRKKESHEVVRRVLVLHKLYREN